jgi:hypothetical protein
MIRKLREAGVRIASKKTRVVGVHGFLLEEVK